MHTFRGGTGWTGSTWPASPGTADVTKWTYEAATGLLTSKTHGHGSADADTISYTYTSEGKLYTRTWARTPGSSALVTTYSYDANTGEMTGVDYSDSTPDVTYTYDRLGRQETITDAVGTRTFTYRSSDLQLETEDIDGSSGGLYSKLITRKYETAGTGTLAGRPAPGS